MADAPRMQNDPTTPLDVTVVDGEIVITGFATVAPSLSADAARATAKRLLKAADSLTVN